MGFNDTMKALSDPTRREILDLLKKESMTAGEIGENFDMTGATISHHLSQLKKAGLISESREKNFIRYSLNASVLEEVLMWISSFQGGDK
ncbi:MAG: autorepressor SdpR family transcription factor [Lachnospiraceae bacterium]|nr:autorepressor SdpR family transcription factor [Lachnospiraceae bacterium]